MEVPGGFRRWTVERNFVVAKCVFGISVKGDDREGLSYKKAVSKG